MGAVGGEGVVKALDGFLDVFFRHGYFCQAGVNFLDLVINGRGLRLRLFPFRPGEDHGFTGLGGFQVAKVEVGIRLEGGFGRKERLGECFRGFLGVVRFLFQAAFGEFQGLARFFRQVRNGEHFINGLDGFLCLSRPDQVRDVVQGARVRARFRAQQSGAEQGCGGQGGHAAASGTAEGAPAGTCQKSEEQADEGRNGKDDVAVVRHAAHFLPAFRDVQAVRDVPDEAVQRRSVGELHILAVRLPGQVLQAFRIELGDDMLAAAVPVQAGGGLLIRNGGADGGADARRYDDELVLPGGFRRLVSDVDGVFPVAEDDQGVFGVRLLVPLEGLEGQPDDVFQIGASLGDPAELKLFDGFLQRVVVMGKGHEQDGVPGEDDDAEVVPRQGVQQVVGGGFSPSQAGGGGVLAEHGAGAVNGDEDIARFGNLLYLRVAVHRTRDGEDGEDGSQHGKDDGEHPVPGGRSVNQLLPVFRGDEHFPFSGTAAPQPPGRRREQGREDERVQNVGIKEGHGGKGMVLRGGGRFEHLQGEAQ